MPIRPEMKLRYPANWPDIRARIQSRAGNRCERCGVPNRQWVFREQGDPFAWYAASCRRLANVIRHALEFTVRKLGREITLTEAVEIVCTTAHHPDPAPENCGDDNLHFWCQRCHLGNDAPLRALRRQQRKQLVLIG